MLKNIPLLGLGLLLRLGVGVVEPTSTIYPNVSVFGVFISVLTISIIYCYGCTVYLFFSRWLEAIAVSHAETVAACRDCD